MMAIFDGDDGRYWYSGIILMVFDGVVTVPV